MLKTSSVRLRQLISDLSDELKGSTDHDAGARPLRQVLALLQAAVETLDELEQSRARAAANIRRLALVTPGS